MHIITEPSHQLNHIFDKKSSRRDFLPLAGIFKPKSNKDKNSALKCSKIINAGILFDKRNPTGVKNQQEIMRNLIF